MIIPALLLASLLAGSFENFIYTSAGNLGRIEPLLARPGIAGVQVVYAWKILEVSEGRYNFAPVERDLALATSLHKKLFIQIQDRFFSPGARNIPRYLLTDPIYGGGLVSQTDNPGEDKPPAMGWVAQQWNPNLHSRYQLLLQALADKFDGKIYGINLPETAIDIDTRHDRTGFTCDNYFQAEMENLMFARRAFKKSYVVQYVNFWPCEWNNDHDYMRRLFDLAAQNNIGLCGPDIVPEKKAQMSNSYPFFFKYKDRLALVAMAVQEPTLTYKNPKTGKRFTVKEFEDFGRNYLGAKIIFWSPDALTF